MSSLCAEARIERESCNLAQFDGVLNETIWFKHAFGMVRLSSSVRCHLIALVGEARPVSQSPLIAKDRDG
jgi:hypothetical protein